MTERAEMEAVIEAVLFVASEPVPETSLLELFDDAEREEAAEALAAVRERYGGAASGMQVDEAAGGLRLVTRPELHGWLRRFFESTGSSKLSMAALETLAIIAYRQPVTAPEIQELRGVNPSGVVKTLLERRLVRIAGRKEVVGKPFLYATTKEFLVHFGLDRLDDLPPLEEFEESFGEDGAGSVAAVLEARSEGSARDGGGDDRDDPEETFLQELAAVDEASEERDEPEEDGA